jgi:hypothetical protein
MNISVGIFAADIYISTNGNDSNNGTNQFPFATLERAQKEILKTGVENESEEITIWIAEGNYSIQTSLTFAVSDFGKIQNKVTFKALPGEKVQISGGVEIVGWKKNKDGIWEANLPENLSSSIKVRELFINNERAVRARFPNNDFLRVNKVGADRRTNFFFANGDFPLIQQPENVELVLLHDWSVSRIKVKEINTIENKLTAVDSIGAKNPDFFNLDHWEEHPRYFLENAIEFLDAGFEWFYDKLKQKFYLKLPENKNPTQMKISIPISEGLIHFAGSENHPVKNIHFEGITFRHSLWNIPEQGYGGVQACHYDPRPNADGWNVVPAAIFAEWAENCSFENCSFENLGGSGLWFGTGCKNCSIINSVFNDISGNGIMIGEGRDRVVNGEPWWKVAKNQAATGNQIKNCVVKKCGEQFYGAVGIWCGLTVETVIKNNEIYDLPYTGISIGWMWSPEPTPCRDNVIDGNHIHHILQVLSDGGGIYSLGLQPGSKILNNHIHDVRINAGRAESNGMFLDEGTTDVIIANNLIYNIAKSPLRFHRATTNLVKENFLFCTNENPPIRYNTTKEEDIQKVDNKVFSETDSNYLKELESIIKKWDKQK